MCVYILLMMLGKIRDFAIRTHHLFQSIPQIYIHLIICFRFFFIFRLCVCLMLCRKHICSYVHSVLQNIRDWQESKEDERQEKRDTEQAYCARSCVSVKCECEWIPLCMFVVNVNMIVLSLYLIEPFGLWQNLTQNCGALNATQTRAHTHKRALKMCIKYGKQLNTSNGKRKAYMRQAIERAKKRERISECASTCTVCLLARSHQW